MASLAFFSIILALFFVMTRCSHRNNHVGFNFNHQADNNDVKRPFGGGGIFSRTRTSDDRWGDQRPLTPWGMSKVNQKQHDANRHHSRPPNDEDINYGVMKRPFGPRIYTRPSNHYSANRVEKRPFGGNMIFSKPRVAGTKPRFGGYPISRARRENSWRAAWMQPREISDRKTEKSHSSVSQKGWEEDERDEWLEGLERSEGGGKHHRQMSLAPYNDDYKGGKYDGIFRKDQIYDDDEKEEEKEKEKEVTERHR